MKRDLRLNVLYHYKDGKILKGFNSKMKGDKAELTGDCTDLTGDCRIVTGKPL